MIKPDLLYFTQDWDKCRTKASQCCSRLDRYGNLSRCHTGCQIDLLSSDQGSASINWSEWSDYADVEAGRSLWNKLVLWAVTRAGVTEMGLDRRLSCDEQNQCNSWWPGKIDGHWLVFQSFDVGWIRRENPNTSTTPLGGFTCIEWQSWPLLCPVVVLLSRSRWRQHEYSTSPSCELCECIGVWHVFLLVSLPDEDLVAFWPITFETVIFPSGPLLGEREETKYWTVKLIQSYKLIAYFQTVDRLLKMTCPAVFFAVSHSPSVFVILLTNFINIQLRVRQLHPCSPLAGQTGLFLKREEE